MVPAEGLDLFDEVETLEVSGELKNESGIEFPIEGVTGKAVFEVIENVPDARIERKGSEASWAE